LWDTNSEPDSGTPNRDPNSITETNGNPDSRPDRHTWSDWNANANTYGNALHQFFRELRWCDRARSAVWLGGDKRNGGSPTLGHFDDYA
jgi:hypothetical protein